MSSLIAVIIVALLVYLLFKNVNKNQKNRNDSSMENQDQNRRRKKSYGKWIGGGLGWAFGGPLENGNYKMKSKTFSNVREGANADDLNAVAEALASLQKYDLQETYQVITNRIG